MSAPASLNIIHSITALRIIRAYGPLTHTQLTAMSEWSMLDLSQIWAHTFEMSFRCNEFPRGHGSYTIFIVHKNCIWYLSTPADRQTTPISREWFQGKCFAPCAICPADCSAHGPSRSLVLLPNSRHPNALLPWPRCHQRTSLDSQGWGTAFAVFATL